MEKVKYPKIQSLFKRDEKTHTFINEFTLPEFEYLRYNKWIGTEKIDGTNIRVSYDGESIYLDGRDDNSQIPNKLVSRLCDIFKSDLMSQFSENTIFFGEGFGNGIQKSGKFYNSDGVDFILFDVMVNGWWLDRESVNSVAKNLGIMSVPVVYTGDIYGAIEMVKYGFRSFLNDDFNAEGLVLEPMVQLYSKKGARENNRIQTKLKTRDFLQTLPIMQK